MTPILQSSVVDYPERGPWGDKDYPGNTTGYLIIDLLDTFGAITMLDPMEGSGTARDVAKEKGVAYLGYDIAQGHDILRNETRAKIRQDVLEQFSAGADLIFWHPPYWKMVRYDLINPADFSNGPYAQYLARMWRTIGFLRQCINAFNPNARLAIQLGDYRSDGRYFWISRDISDVGKLHGLGWALGGLLIRKQRGVKSDATGYSSSKPLIRIMHETVVILEPIQ